MYYSMRVVHFIILNKNYGGITMEKFTLNYEDSVLFIIDIQERLAKVMKDRDQVINNTNVLISASEELGFPIIYTEQYPKGLGRTASELQKGLEEAHGYEKVHFTAYIDEVKEILEKIDRKKIIITGMETHVCVFQTARDLIDNGYKVFIVKDAVSSRTNENYENGLDLLKEMGAVITNTETVIFDLLKEAGTPEFKILSKLIK